MLPFDYILSNDKENLLLYLEHQDVNVVDHKGKSLLMYAIMTQNSELFHILMKAYINVNLMDSFGNTAYHYAVINNRIGFLKVLLKSIGNATSKNKFGETPLYLACLYGREQMVFLFSETQIISLSQKNDRDETLFVALVRSKNIPLIKKLGAYQKLIEVPNYLGDTPLAIAVAQNSLEMVKFLLEEGAFVNSRNHLKETPLMISIKKRYWECAKLLISYGALPFLKNTFSENCFDIVPDDMKDYFSCEYAQKFPVHTAIYENDLEKLKSVIELKNIEIKDNYGYTPLDIANYYQNKRAIKILEMKKRKLKMLTI